MINKAHGIKRLVKMLPLYRPVELEVHPIHSLGAVNVDSNISFSA